ncbi:hypothetical protein ACOSP7_029225 [Xanthoceras sorbifolium]
MEEEQSSCLDFASSVAMMGSYYVLFSLRGIVPWCKSFLVAFAESNFKELLRRVDRLVHWIPPIHGAFKINTYAALDFFSGNIGLGVADAFTHKYGVWLRAASPPLPRERFNCSTRGQEFSRGTRTTEEGERDTVRGGETVVRDPVSETPQQVSFKGKEKVGGTVPVSSSTAVIVNYPDIVAANQGRINRGNQFPSSSPIVCNASEILSPHIPPITEPFIYGIGGGPKPVFETVNLHSYMQKDVGSGSLDRPLLDDTLTVPIDPGPSGVTHKIVDPLEYHNVAPSTDCHVVTSHAISGTDVHPRGSRWKCLARKGKQHDMVVNLKPKRRQPEVGHSDEAPVSKCRTARSFFWEPGLGITVP